MPLKFSPRDSAFALAIIVIWGMNFVVMKYAMRDFTAFQMGAVRFLFAAALFEDKLFGKSPGK